MVSPEISDSYIQLANEICAQQNKALLESLSLLQDPLPVIQTLLQRWEERLYQHPGQAWAAALVAETIAARASLQLQEGRAAVARAWAANLWVHMEEVADAAASAQQCFAADDSNWLSVAIWQQYAQPWMVGAAKALEALEPLQARWPVADPTGYRYFPHYLLSLAWAFSQNGKPEPALETIATAERYLTEMKDDVGLAYCQFVRGAVWRARGQARESVVYYEEAGRLIEEIDAAAYAIRIYCGYAYALRLGRSDFVGAAAAFEKAIEVGEEIEVPYWKTNAQIGLAEIYELQGHLTKAADLARDVRASFIEQGRITGVIDSLIDSSAFHYELGQFQAALGYAQEGLLLHKQQPTYMVQEIVLNTNLGVALWQLGRYQQALKQLEQAKSLTATAEFAVRRAEVVIYLAYVWHELGQIEEAEQAYQEAYVIAQDKDNISLRYDLAVLEADLRFAHEETRQLVDALQTHIEYMISKESRLYEYRLKKLQVALLVQAGYYQEALPLLQGCLEAFQEMGMIGAEAKTQLLLGNVFQRLQQPQLAQEAWQRTIAISTKQPQNRWQAHARLAQVAQRQNQAAEVILHHYREALFALSTIRQTTWQTALLSGYLADAQEVMDAAVLFASQNFPEQTLAFVEMSKAHALSVQVRQELSAETLGLSAEAQQVRQQLASLEYEMAREDISLLQRLRTQSNWSKLAKEYARLQAVYERARQTAELEGSSWELFQLSDVREKAKRQWGTDWLAIDYYLTGRRLVMVVITADELWVEEKEASQLAALVEFASEADGLREEHLQQLAQILLSEAIVESLTPQTVLLIAPHAQLHRVPWAALASKNGRPLVMDCQPLVIPSLQLFTVLEGQGTQLQKGLLTAVADFPKRTVASLPFTQTEAAAIQDATAIAWLSLLNQEATWQELQTIHQQQAEWSELDCWHIATHAFFREQGNGRVCGLSLYDQDIWLDEVAQLAPLPSLVTLSACSGLPSKVFSGDDHAGLAATCLTAGSKNVIGSLWLMDDKGSAQLFVLVYKQLLVTHNPLQALVAAQRQFVQEGRPLAWWGGVQIIGRGV